MNNDGYIYHFNFQPTKLRHAGREVQRRYEDMDRELAERVTAYRLPRMLEIIRMTPAEQITKWAETLKKTDVRVLLYQYPYSDESHDTQYKINIVISSRFTSSIGRYAWGGLFSHIYSNIYLQDLLRRMYNVDSFEFLITANVSGMQNAVREAIIDRSGIASGLVSYLTSASLCSSELIPKLQIKKGSPLESYLLFEMYKKGLRSDDFVKREGETTIRIKLEVYPVDEYKLLAKVYIEERNHASFHPRLMEQAILRLYDPRERPADWEFLNENSIAEVKRWLVINELKRFFEEDKNNDRFEYWSRYLHYIDDVIQLKGKDNPKVAFIYFNQFVVVEFGDMGAAYFYHRSGFDRWILPRTQDRSFRGSRSIPAKERKLKDISKSLYGEPLFINKLPHLGDPRNWKSKFTKHMQAYFSNDFNYYEVP
ncbi:EH_Signature domain-containing protein [Paenibacillaceae bacterium GAS479]|nr:EH_Signature domain-containing protein [Paenibacillaceae bacterium GAS479]